MKSYESDVVIAGAGIAGLVTAYELLKKGLKVIIFDKDEAKNIGGLANWAAGFIHLIDTPQQRALGIADSPELAFEDWLRMAKFDDDEIWPKKWAEFYCFHATPNLRQYFDEIDIQFVEFPQWAERGLYYRANTYPRMHMFWGTAYQLVVKAVEAIDKLPQRHNLQIMFEHEVNDVRQGDGFALFKGKDMRSGEEFEAIGQNVVVATGGIGGGDLSELKKHWPGDGRKAPDNMLCGAHKYGNGLMHHKLEAQGAILSNLKHNWPYAAGVRCKDVPEESFTGLSLQPGPGILWMNGYGERIGPMPLMVLADTPWLIEQILAQPGQYTWLVLNWRLAIKELQVAVSRYFSAIRAIDRELLLHNIQEGDVPRINKLLVDCPDDIVMADTLDELMDKMQSLSLYGFQINREQMKADIEAYDRQIDAGEPMHNDEQLRRIANYSNYMPNLCKFQKIVDESAGPLMAIRVFLISRKSLGGIQTNLQCRALKKNGEPFENIFAVGECAGYGGGGMHGKGAPEGAFLGGCILTGLVCGREIK